MSPSLKHTTRKPIYSYLAVSHGEVKASCSWDWPDIPITILCYCVRVFQNCEEAWLEGHLSFTAANETSIIPIQPGTSQTGGG